MEPIPRPVDLTRPAGHASGLARMEARRLGQHDLGPERFLLGLLLEGENLAARVLVAHGLDLETVRAQVDQLIEQGHSQLRIAAPFAV
jgi:ATP-dependent Clp protease ATP-binding subunit ClpC